MIHADLGAGNLLATAGPEPMIAGVLDFEVAGRDLRVNDLVVLLFQSGCLAGADWPARTAALADGFGEVLRLRPAEIMIVPELITARGLGSGGRRAARRRTGVSSVDEVADRVRAAQATEQWVTAHGPALVELLGRRLG